MTWLYNHDWVGIAPISLESRRYLDEGILKAVVGCFDVSKLRKKICEGFAGSCYAPFLVLEPGRISSLYDAQT
jgi:hypothetical protein